MKNKMTKLKRLLVGSTSRKTKITLPPMPDNMLKNDYPDWKITKSIEDIIKEMVA